MGGSSDPISKAVTGTIGAATSVVDHATRSAQRKVGTGASAQRRETLRARSEVEGETRRQQAAEDESLRRRRSALRAGLGQTPSLFDMLGGGGSQ